jgi:poly(ribitol-phosphate) beta-N-acetylglucosaminyltransferase
VPAVSVIVPVFNPGDRIEPCVESLLGQTLGDVELIFVDDGSTDGTPARLDTLAAGHPHVRVEHMPNSGWPGRPRNRGLDLATGDYVYFVDDDDWLEPEALERLRAMALGDDADIVIGKVVGHGKASARRLFAENVHGIRFTDRPLLLLKLLTPHKLFRRELIERHGLRFPEGRRRLEDHVFVVGTYVHAERISVLADYPCYHWVFHDREVNASHQPVDAGYFEDLRGVLDLVERHLEPGVQRERVLAHWYRQKMLSRLTGHNFITAESERRSALFTAIRVLALERWDDRVQARLPFNLRVRSRLLRDGSLDGLIALARFEAGLRARTRLHELDAPGSHVALRVGARLEGGKWPLEFSRRGDSIRWEPPAALRELLADPDLDVTGDLPRSRVRLHLEALDRGLQYELDAPSELDLGDGAAPEPAFMASASIDPAVAAAGGALAENAWYVRATVEVAGFSAVGEVPFDKRPLTLHTRPGGRIAASTGPKRRASLRRRAARKLPWLAREVRRLRAGN